MHEAWSFSAWRFGRRAGKAPEGPPGMSRSPPAGGQGAAVSVRGAASGAPRLAPPGYRPSSGCLRGHRATLACVRFLTGSAGGSYTQISACAVGPPSGGWDSSGASVVLDTGACDACLPPPRDPLNPLAWSLLRSLGLFMVLALPVVVLACDRVGDTPVDPPARADLTAAALVLDQALELRPHGVERGQLEVEKQVPGFGGVSVAEGGRHLDPGVVP